MMIDTGLSSPLSGYCFTFDHINGAVCHIMKSTSASTLTTSAVFPNGESRCLAHGREAESWNPVIVGDDDSGTQHRK